jgi:hypothetical protein
MGVNEECFDAEAWVIRRYSVSCEVRYKKDKSKIRIVTVYGTTYEEFKQDFLDELLSWWGDALIPTLIGGLQSG